METLLKKIKALDNSFLLQDEKIKKYKEKESFYSKIIIFLAVER